MSTSSAAPERTVVCPADDLAPGNMVAATLGPLPIVVVRTSTGGLQAFVDRCLHQGARLSAGRLLDATEGERVGEYRLVDGRDVLKCPWHGYEYDAETGCGLFDRRRRLRRVRVREEDGLIVAERRAAHG
jgi:nitrite reductase/ring-hydroxylating ferredoxin subunit